MKRANSSQSINQKIIIPKADQKTTGIQILSTRKPFQRIIKLNDKIILQALKQQEYKSVSTLLGQLQSLIDKQDHTANKKIYFYQYSVFYYNKAYLSQQLQQYDQCVKYLQKSIQNFQIMMGYVKSRQENVAFNCQYTKMLLQLCAVMSQNSLHKQAIAFAEKSLNKLIECFRVLQAICYQHILLHTEPQTTQNSLQSTEKSDKVNFKKIVIKQAEKKLIELSSLPSTHKLILQDKQYYEGIIKNIYFWKDNAENNQKILRKQLDLDKVAASPRNILGVQKTSSLVQQFHIGTLMSLKPKKIKFEMNTDTYYLLSSQKILEMVLYCSVCYFTIATETRFNEFENDLQSLKISQKYKKLHKDDTISKCKLLHIKAIQLAAKYLPPSNFFFNHLLSSFNKNYKFMLDQIGEQSEVTIKDYQPEPQNQQVLQSQYGIPKQIEKTTNKKVTRKRSKTNQKLKPKCQSTKKVQPFKE